MVGGLLSGEMGVAAFRAVLVCLPGGGGGSLEPLLVTCLVPLAWGWVLGQAVTGSFFFSPLLPSILTPWKVMMEGLMMRSCTGGFQRLVCSSGFRKTTSV